MEGIVEGLDSVFGILHAVAKGSLKSENVSESSTFSHQQTSLPCQLHHLICLLSSRLLALWILDNLNTNHQTFSSYVADDFMLCGQSLEFFQKISSNFLTILSQLFSFNNVENFHADSALKMSSSESVKEDMINFIHDLFACDDCSHREAVTNTLCHSHDIGLNSLPSMTPVFGSNSSEACLNLISNDQTMMLVADYICDFRPVAFGHGVDATYTLDRLQNKSSNFSMRSRVNNFLGISDEAIHGCVSSSVGAGPGQFFEFKASPHR